MTTNTITRSDFTSFASDFNDYLEDEGLEPVEVRLDYSGRAMYGRTCVAFVTDEPFVTTLRLGMFLARFGTDDVIVAAFDRSDVRTDSMGRGTVMYWPSIEVA